MSTLHTRGYRPKPGERTAKSGARVWWYQCWRHVREAGRLESAFDNLAHVLLIASMQPDELTRKRTVRILRRALARKNASSNRQTVAEIPCTCHNGS